MNTVTASLQTLGTTQTPAQESRDGLRRTRLSPLLERMASTGWLRARALRLALRLEDGMFWSATARSIMHSHFGVSIGAYSYGECFVPGMMPPGTVIGRYVSMAAGVRVFVRNHPMERLSLHPFFYNHKLGFVERDTIESGTLEIGHETWIGEQAIITPGCRRIGIGAVVGAGAVVTKDVPEFAIVGGNPARVLRMRFDPAMASKLIDSRWWERSLTDLLPFTKDLIRPVSDIDFGHPLLKPHA